MRILSIDFGRKRTGLAVTDPLQIIAGGLATVATSSLFDYLKDYISKEPVDTIVVGLPKRLNGEPSESMRYITPFVAALRKTFPQIPVEMYDERFTSTIAHQAMIDGGKLQTESFSPNPGIRIIIFPKNSRSHWQKHGNPT